jgi:hypothetical protein
MMNKAVKQESCPESRSATEDDGSKDFQRTVGPIGHERIRRIMKLFAKSG